MNAEIITVGTELLLGEVVDTNGSFLSSRLAGLGIDVFHRTVVGDNKERITDALQTAMGRSDIVITTGGLGPTNDDITRSVVAEYFGLPLHEDGEVLAHIIAHFAARGKEMPGVNRCQALIPEGAQILTNENGTAPGIYLEKDGKIIILLPGVPSEMEHIFVSEAEPKLRKKSGQSLYMSYIHIINMAESAVYEKLQPLIDSQTNPTMALYAQTGEVMLRLACKAEDEVEAKKLLTQTEREVIKQIGHYIYGFGEETTLERAVVDKLREKHIKVALAESCTGGMIAKMITDVPGSSEAFNIGYVTYSNAAKQRELSVSSHLLDKYGVVSREVAEDMAINLRRKTGASIAVSVTGLAGPGTVAGKPAGLVYISVMTKKGAQTHKCQFSGDRNRVRLLAAKYALFLILEAARAYISSREE